MKNRTEAQRTLDIKMANTLADEATAQYAHAVSGLVGKENEEQLIGAYMCDLGNHMIVAGRIWAGDIARAQYHANSMDTFPRENIPQTVWDYIHDSANL